jgi:hypothetical protein
MRRHMPCSITPCLPAKVGSRASTCPVAANSTSLIGRALMPPCVSWLQTCWEGSGVPCVLWLRILPPYQEGSSAATRPAVPYEPRASSIKKNLASLTVQLGSHVSKAHAHVAKTPDISAIMDLQDMRAGSAFNAYKKCGQAAIVWLQCSTAPVDHSPSTATVSGDPTTWCHIADREPHGRTTRQDAPHAIKDIICYF